MKAYVFVLEQDNFEFMNELTCKKIYRWFFVNS